MFKKYMRVNKIFSTEKIPRLLGQRNEELSDKNNKTKNALINQTLTKINHINDEYLIIINKFKQSKLDTLVLYFFVVVGGDGYMERMNRTGQRMFKLLELFKLLGELLLILI